MDIYGSRAETNLTVGTDGQAEFRWGSGAGHLQMALLGNAN